MGVNAKWEDVVISDLGGELHYSIDKCIEIKLEHISILKAYM